MDKRCKIKIKTQGNVQYNHSFLFSFDINDTIQIFRICYSIKYENSIRYISLKGT